MHATKVILVLAALLIPHAAALQSSFWTPANANGKWNVDNGEWVLVYIADSTSIGVFDVLAPASMTNMTFVPQHRLEAPGFNGTFNPAYGPEKTSTIPATHITTASGSKGAAYLVVRASHLRTAGVGTSDLSATSSGHVAGSAVQDEAPLPLPTWILASNVTTFTNRHAATISIEAAGNIEVTWYGMTTTCTPATTGCPTGGGEYWGQGLPPYLRVWQASRETIRSSQGLLNLQVMSGSVAIGGASLSLAVNGTVRLPLMQTCDPSCVRLGTVTMEGNTLLTGITYLDGNHAEANVTGDLLAVQTDENPVSPESVGFTRISATSITITGLAAIGFVLWRFIAGILAARHAEPTLHPRRSAILQVIQADPGVHFREIGRRLPYSRSNLAHHISVLKRSGLIEEVPIGGRTTFHVNAARNPGEDRLPWLPPRMQPLVSALQKGIATQADLIRHMQNVHAWKRSTTQYRLEALVRSGVAAATKEGRSIRYRLAH